MKREGTISNVECIYVIFPKYCVDVAKWHRGTLYRKREVVGYGVDSDFQFTYYKSNPEK